jgi:hypothetical protein
MENIIFRKSWFRTLSRWEPARVAQFIKLLEDYINDRPIEITDGRILDLWDQVEPLLYSDREKYYNKVQTNRENGKKGGRPKNPQEPTETQRDIVGYEENPKNPKEKDKDKDKDNEIEKDNDIVITSGKEVLAENQKNLFQLLCDLFINQGVSLEEAKENTISYMKLHTDEEVEDFINLNSNGLSQVK